MGLSTRIPSLLMFGHYQYLAAHSRLTAHQHPGALEICFLARGEQTYRVGRKIYRLRGGDIFITFPDEWHDTADEPQQKGELYWIIIQAKPLPPQALHLPPAFAQELVRGITKLSCRHFRAAPDSADILAKLETALQARKNTRSCLNASCSLQQFLIATWEAGSAAQHNAPGQRVRAAMDWMETHLDEPARICEVASAVGWSEAHFKTAFRNETGQTPHDYYLRRKIDKARQLLAAGQQSVTEIAHALGFSSSQHFATSFRKFTGNTPTSTRNTQSSYGETRKESPRTYPPPRWR